MPYWVIEDVLNIEKIYCFIVQLLQLHNMPAVTH